MSQRGVLIITDGFKLGIAIINLTERIKDTRFLLALGIFGIEIKQLV